MAAFPPFTLLRPYPRARWVVGRSMTADPTLRPSRPRAELVPDGPGFRWRVVFGDLRSAPSSDCYPTEAAAWAAATRAGLERLPE